MLLSLHQSELKPISFKGVANTDPIDLSPSRQTVSQMETTSGRPRQELKLPANLPSDWGVAQHPSG